MITINLANSILKKSDVRGGNINAKDMTVKVALIILPIIGICIYEKFDIDRKKEQATVVQQQLVKLDEELQSHGSVDDIVRVVNEQKKEMDEKFNVMRQIFGNRTQKILALTALQKHIPQSCWLTKILVKGRDMQVEGTALSLEETQIYSTLLAQEKNLFETVNNKGVNTDKVNGVDMFKFQIVIKLKD